MATKILAKMVIHEAKVVINPGEEAVVDDARAKELVEADAATIVVEKKQAKQASKE